MKNPDIVGIKIRDDKSNLYAAGEVWAKKDSGARVFYFGPEWVERDSLVNSEQQLVENSFPLFHVAEDNEVYEIGVATLYSANSIIFEKLKPKVFLIIINAVIKTAILGFIILMAGRRLLSAPLSVLTSAVKKIDLKNLEKIQIEIKSSEKNELTILADAFNSMLQTLLRARSNLYKSKEHLETRVSERTAELSEAYAKLKLEEEASKASEAELKALFEGMSDVVMVLNDEGRYLKIAPSSPELLYRPADNLLGKTLHKVFPQNKADHFMKHIRQSLESQKTVNMEYSLDIDGKGFWFDGAISPMSDKEVIFVARDITERRRWELELEKAKQNAEAGRRRFHFSDGHRTWVDHMSKVCSPPQRRDPYGK